MADYEILVLPGDGIGPEVTREGVRLLTAVGERFEHAFRITEDLVGGAAIDAHGTAIRDETIEQARASHAVLWGAVGGPRWDDPTAPVRPEQGLLRIRRELGLWANLRPVAVDPALAAASPLRSEVLAGVDLLVVRELTSGAYFGRPQERRVVGGLREAVDTIYYNEEEVGRVARLGFELARGRRGRLHSIDKANVLESSRLWREIVHEVRAGYPDVEYSDMLVDAAAMHLIRRPSDFDVVIASNLFGDILTDEASMLAGSLGMLPSASVGGDVSLYEPVHGAAPDIAGRGIANPIGAILSVAMMLELTFALPEEAAAVQTAVNRVLEDGHGTDDLHADGGPAAVSTARMGEVIVRALRAAGATGR